MTQDQVKQLEETIINTISKTLTSKIDNLDTKIEEYIEHDLEWKKTVQPVIDAYTTVGRVGDFTAWASKVILAIGVIIGTIFGVHKL